MHEYYYSRKDPHGPSPISFFVSLAILGMFPIMMVFVILSSITVPRALPKDPGPVPVMIEDNADLFTDADESEMMKTLTEFYDKTGIIPYVETEYNSTWKNNYSNIETYAYEQYVKRFSDEKHYLLLYTQSKQTDDSFTDWNWWAIRGNDTGDIITASNFARFQKTFQDTLFSAGESMDGKTGYIVKAVEMAFGEAPQYMVNYPGTSSQAS